MAFRCIYTTPGRRVSFGIGPDFVQFDNDKDIFAKITGPTGKKLCGSPKDYATQWANYWEIWEVQDSQSTTGVPSLDYLYNNAIEFRNGLPNRVDLAPDEMEGRIPDKDSLLVSNSVQKKVYRDLGLVVVKKAGHQDYTNEASAHSALYGSNLTSLPTEAKKPIPYFSFQKPLTENEAKDLDNRAVKGVNWGVKQGWWGKKNLTNDVDSDKVRRFSVYGGTSQAEAKDLDYIASDSSTHSAKNMSLREYLKLLISSKSNRTAKKQDDTANLWSCFHQVVMIHRELYVAKVTHGDMHMGNVKVILVYDPQLRRKVPVCKAFDFGKFSSGSNYTRTDLRYLISKTAVPRFMGNSSIETNKRAKRWRDESTRGENHVDRLERTDWKHYPLHKILEAILEINGVFSLSTGEISRVMEESHDSRIHSIITTAGLPFLDVLNTTRGGPDESARLNSIHTAFQIFSNLCVEQFYRSYPRR